MCYYDNFILSILAGMAISLGGLVYTIGLPLHIGIAAFAFSIGLCLVFKFKLNLYTGKIGFLCYNIDMKFILVCLFGNIIGSAFFAGITNILFPYLNFASICTGKLSKNPFIYFVASMCCGVIIYLAVVLFNKSNERYYTTTICVMVFILLGFEHSIANSYFFFANGDMIGWLKTVPLAIVGNGLGSIGFNFLCRKAEII